jgi:hypothetical protein
MVIIHQRNLDLYRRLAREARILHQRINTVAMQVDIMLMHFIDATLVTGWCCYGQAGPTGMPGPQVPLAAILSWAPTLVCFSLIDVAPLQVRQGSVPVAQWLLIHKVGRKGAWRLRLAVLASHLVEGLYGPVGAALNGRVQGLPGPSGPAGHNGAAGVGGPPGE